MRLLRLFGKSGMAECQPSRKLVDGAETIEQRYGSISPKYIDYIVKFLEHTGMTVWENEMKNLWYIRMDSIDKNLTSKSAYNEYIHEDKLDTLIDSDGDQYYWFWLTKKKWLFKFKSDLSFEFYFDISKIKKYFFSKIKSQAGGRYSQLAGGDDSQLAGGDESQLAGGYRSQLAGGRYSQLAGGGYSQLVGGRYSQLALTWEGAIGVWGHNSRVQWVIGSVFMLCEEHKDNYNIEHFASFRIDGKKYKENTWYTMKNGKIIEVEE